MFSLSNPRSRLANSAIPDLLTKSPNLYSSFGLEHSYTVVQPCGFNPYIFAAMYADNVVYRRLKLVQVGWRTTGKRIPKLNLTATRALYHSLQLRQGRGGRGGGGGKR